MASWTALQLAVQMEWGGPDSREKYDWLLEETISLFSRKGSRIELDDLLDLFEGVLEAEFQTIAEDGSCEEISKMLLRLFHECIHGKVEYLHEIQAMYDESQRKGYAKNCISIPNEDEEVDQEENSASSEDEEMH